MKKKYIKPTTDILELTVDSIMQTVSGTWAETKGDYDNDVKDLSKGHTFDIWDLDEEED